MQRSGDEATGVVRTGDKPPDQEVDSVRVEKFPGDHGAGKAAGGGSVTGLWAQGGRAGSSKMAIRREERQTSELTRTGCGLTLWRCDGGGIRGREGVDVEEEDGDGDGTG